MWQQEWLRTLPVIPLLPALLTYKLRLQPWWWLSKPTQQIEVSSESEGLVRQCFEVVRSMVVKTRQGLCAAADRNQLPGQASLELLKGATQTVLPMREAAIQVKG